MSSMEHQEVNLGQQQNQDLIWDLDSIARRELAERFIKLFENRLCVYSESTRQLYTNYNLHFPADYGRKMVVLPNPYAFHDTLHGIDPVASRKTGLCVLPGVVLGKPGLLLTTQVAGPLLAEEAARKPASVYEQLDLFGSIFERIRAQYVEQVDEGAELRDVDLGGHARGVAVQPDLVHCVSFGAGGSPQRPEPAHPAPRPPRTVRHRRCLPPASSTGV